MLYRGSNCSLARALDGRIMCCGIISSCQSAPEHVFIVEQRYIKYRTSLHFSDFIYSLPSLCSVCVEVCLDWSDHALWWPDKNFWLLRTRSTLDQYGVQADARLIFTPMHKNVRVLLPDLQDVDVRVSFSSDVFAVVVKLCKELGQSLIVTISK